jgi:hypothetical protein
VASIRGSGAFEVTFLCNIIKRYISRRRRRRRLRRRIIIIH